MATKPVTVEKQQTAETIIAHVKALLPEERKRVFDFANRHKENKAVSQLLELAFTALRFLDMTLTSAERFVGNADAFRERLVDGITAEGVFEELTQKMERVQATRQMSPESRETLERYKFLHKPGSKQIAVLHVLVKEQGEQHKRYVIEYHKNKNIDAVKDHIKGLLRTEKKHQKRPTA